jgi:hypothetical protein
MQNLLTLADSSAENLRSTIEKKKKSIPLKKNRPTIWQLMNRAK